MNNPATKLGVLTFLLVFITILNLGMASIPVPGMPGRAGDVTAQTTNYTWGDTTPVQVTALSQAFAEPTSSYGVIYWAAMTICGILLVIITLLSIPGTGG